MTATPLAATSRYIPLGTRQYYWVPTIASKAAPTRIELDAGTDLTTEVMEVNGWEVSSDSVEAPDAASRFTSKIPGKITADDSTLTIYLSDNSTDARTLLTQDTKGFVVIFPEGDVATQKMDVFPVTIASATKSQNLDDPATLVVTFTITAEPATDVDVP